MFAKSIENTVIYRYLNAMIQFESYGPVQQILLRSWERVFNAPLPF